MKYILFGCEPETGTATEVLGTTSVIEEPGELNELRTAMVPCAPFIMQGKPREMTVYYNLADEVYTLAWYEIPGT